MIAMGPTINTHEPAIGGDEARGRRPLHRELAAVEVPAGCGAYSGRSCEARTGHACAPLRGTSGVRQRTSRPRRRVVVLVGCTTGTGGCRHRGVLEGLVSRVLIRGPSVQRELTREYFARALRDEKDRRPTGCRARDSHRSCGDGGRMTHAGPSDALRVVDSHGDGWCGLRRPIAGEESAR